MNLRYILKISLQALRTNKSRSFLTILGIVIGIASIILIMSIGQGAQKLILKEVEGLGAKSLVILPGRQPKGMMDSFESLFSDSLKQKELDALQNKNNAPTVSKIMPIVFGSNSITREDNIYRATILGVSNLAEKAYNLKLTQGFFFSDEDVRALSNVIVLGQKAKEELFGASDALNQIVRVKDKNFRVVGILQKQGAGSFFNFDEAALTPYTTAQQYLFGIKHFHRILVEADSEKDLPQMAEDIKITLRNLHNIDNPDKDDFYIQTQEDIVKTVSTITNVLTLFLAAVAAVSLLVGGVGIMNIMLVSVTERTREIGLRKAVGAKKSDILTQFLAESILLTVIGGITGILIGSLFAFGASFILTKILGNNWSFVFPIGPAILGIIVSAGVGLIFGLYPANKASKKSPIEALRYE